MKLVTPPTAARSVLMSRVRRTGSAPELKLRQALHGLGFRYRIASGKGLPGTPDVALSKFSVAIFVDGCFWHGCPLHVSWPKSNREFWTAKIERNKARDAAANRSLSELGWTVIRVWEHEVEKSLPDVLHRIKELCSSNQPPVV